MKIIGNREKYLSTLQENTFGRPKKYTAIGCENNMRRKFFRSCKRGVQNRRE